MRTLMLAAGTQGDVQPFVALARELALGHGHHVRLATHEMFRDTVEACLADAPPSPGQSPQAPSGPAGCGAGRVEFFPLAGDPECLSAILVENGGLVPRSLRHLKMLRAQHRAILHSCWEACTAPELPPRTTAPSSPGPGPHSGPGSVPGSESEAACAAQSCPSPPCSPDRCTRGGPRALEALSLETPGQLTGFMPGSPASLAPRGPGSPGPCTPSPSSSPSPGSQGSSPISSGSSGSNSSSGNSRCCCPWARPASPPTPRKRSMRQVAEHFRPDAILANPPAAGHLYCAERLGIPCHILFTMPWWPTAEHLHPFSPAWYRNAVRAVRALSPASAHKLTTASYWMMEAFVSLGVLDITNEFRRSVLRVPPLPLLSPRAWWPLLLHPGGPLPMSCAWSPELLPKPREWGPHTQVVGFMGLPRPPQPQCSPVPLHPNPAEHSQALPPAGPSSQAPVPQPLQACPQGKEQEGPRADLGTAGHQHPHPHPHLGRGPPVPPQPSAPGAWPSGAQAAFHGSAELAPFLEPRVWCGEGPCSPRGETAPAAGLGPCACEVPTRGSRGGHCACCCALQPGSPAQGRARGAGQEGGWKGGRGPVPRKCSNGSVWRDPAQPEQEEQQGRSTIISSGPCRACPLPPRAPALPLPLPPLYIGFGSMKVKEPRRFWSTILAALQQVRVRAVICPGWAGRAASLRNTECTLVLDSPVQHSLLFPRCLAVVHHGGAGTTAAGLLAGKPTLVLPFFGDQLLWGSAVCHRGLGPPPVPVKELSEQRLAHALEHLLRPEVHCAAQGMQQRLLNEGDGTQRAALGFLGGVQRFYAGE